MPLCFLRWMRAPETCRMVNAFLPLIEMPELIMITQQKGAFCSELGESKEMEATSASEWRLVLQKQLKKVIDERRERTEIERDDETESSQGCIFKVSALYRKVSPGSFLPVMCLLGPYKDRECAQDSAIAGHQLKLRVASLLKSESFDLLISRVCSKAASVRSSYQNLEVSSTEVLACSLTLDAVFVVGCLLISYVHYEVPNNSGLQELYRMLKPALGDVTIAEWKDIGRDIFCLLENQIPFFVLRYAMEAFQQDFSHIQALAKANLTEVVYLIARANSVFHSRRGSNAVQSANINIPHQFHEPSPLHLLHVMYSVSTRGAAGGVGSVSSSSSRSRTAGLRARIVRQLSSASTLRNFGVSFKGKEGNCTQVDYHPKTSTLHLPIIAVAEKTEDLLRNLLAYESQQLRYDAELGGAVAVRDVGLLSEYLLFMNRLLRKAEDVEVLMEAGVVINYMGGQEEVVEMWGRLCREIPKRSLDNPRQLFYGVTREVEAHARRRHRKWLANFRELYFDSRPWLLASLLAATVLFLLSFLQTYYTLLTYYQPLKQ